MSTRALLVVDVQAGLFAGPPVPLDAGGVIERINGLSRAARAAGAPVVFVQHDGAPGDGLDPESPEWEIHPDLVREPDDVVVRKTACDAFYRTRLAEELERLGARELVVTGYASDFCVDTTVRRAASEGYDVVLVSDAHTTKDRPVLEAKDIVAHANWVFANFIQLDNPVRVIPASEVTFA